MPGKIAGSVPLPPQFRLPKAPLDIYARIGLAGGPKGANIYRGWQSTGKSR